MSASAEMEFGQEEALPPQFDHEKASKRKKHGLGEVQKQPRLRCGI